ncbi:MAG TPA: hypothetical protein VJN18_02360 [Polyangiaceae bacterium]|nr:hypothetical protein [Polyangiaceae bacterium]
MSRLRLGARATTLGWVAALVLMAPACGDDDDSGGAGSGDMPGGGSSSSSAGAESGDEAGSHDGSGGSGQDHPGAAGQGRGGTSSMAGTSSSAAGAPIADAGAGNAAPPGPAPGGGSVYAVECSGETEMCGVERAHCLGINLDTGGTGYACSNRCRTVDDCSDAPSGAPAEAGCVQFTREKRCVLVCYQQPNEYACPDGMSCYIFPSSPIGYCLWVQ